MKIGWFAPWYRWVEYAAFGRTLEQSRLAFLPELADARRVLILGEGDGRTLRRLLAMAPKAHVDLVELSPEMISLARRRVGNSQRVSFQCQDALTADWPPASYDAIVTNFFLDCFLEDDARHLIGRLAASLKPGGTWLISEFATPQNGWRRRHAQVWIGTMYRFFGMITGLRVRTLPPIETLIQQAGMRLVLQQKRRAGLIVSEVWRRQA